MFRAATHTVKAHAAADTSAARVRASRPSWRTAGGRSRAARPAGSPSVRLLFKVMRLSRCSGSLGSRSHPCGADTR
jgi:hypothetical protein